MIYNDLTVRAPDETEVAYSVTGRGPALMLTNGLTTSSFFWKYLQPRWRETHTVITWDLPGHGRSMPARTEASATIEGQPAIMARILDAAGQESATQIGWSVGCQVVLELYKQLPSRCDAVCTLFGPAGHVFSTLSLPVPGSWIHALIDNAQGELSATLVQRIAQIARLPSGPSLLRLLGLVGKETRSDDVRQLVTDLGHVHTASGKRLAISAQAHSAADVLPRMKVPLLILAGDRDPFALPKRVGAPMHELAPNSELALIRGGTHTALLDHAEEIADVIDDFLARRLYSS